MKTVWIVAAAIAAAMFGVVAAQAGDDDARRASSPALVYNWTGFHVGVNAGYGFGDRTATFAAGDPLIEGLTTGPGFPPGTRIPSGSYGLKGATWGVQAGYDVQLAPSWVAGLEADFNGVDFDASATSVFRMGMGLGFSDVVNLAATRSADWFGTVRGRIGWLPAERLLVYGTGGLAYGQIKDTLVFNGPANAVANNATYGFECPGTGASCFVGSSSRLAAGYAVGGGLEYAVSRQFTLRAEYLYVNFGSSSLSASTVVPRAGGYAPASFASDLGDFSFYVVRASLNYRF